MFEILGKGEILDLGVVKNWNMKWVISRQLPDSPPPQEGASDPISRLTGLCTIPGAVYTYSTLIYFLPKSTSFLPNFNQSPTLDNWR